MSVLLILHYNGATSLLPDPQLPTIHSIKGLASMAALPPHGKCDLVLMQLEGCADPFDRFKFSLL